MPIIVDIHKTYKYRLYTSARLYGQRRAKRKAERVRAELKQAEDAES
jgi:hypothetical protein